MELKFNVEERKFLAQQVLQPICQEEVAETIVPDSYPDVERLLTCHGMVTVRNHEYQNGNWVVSGAIHAWVLYSPQDYDTPKTLQYYIPFTVKCPCPQGEHGQGVVHCRVGSMDCQMVNSRKVLVRVTTITDCWVYQGTVQEQHTYQEEAAGQLEVKTATYPFVEPLAVGKKGFSIEETVELTAGSPAIKTLCQYQCGIEPGELKLVGNKGVFKGICHGWILYESQEDTLHTWVFQVPFAQYVEFEQDYDDKEMELSFLLTDLQIEPQGQALGVKAEVTAQCIVTGNCLLETIEDAYSTSFAFAPQWAMVETASRLDRQHFNQVARATKDCAPRSILETQAYIGSPVMTQKENLCEVLVPLTAHVLYEDERGEYQGEIIRAEALFETEVMGAGQWKLQVALAGEPFAVLAGDGVEVRCAVSLDMELWAAQSMPMLIGGELGEVLDKSQYPSLVLRHVAPEDDLWSVAKTCRTTMADIAAANHMDSLEEAIEGMILIPVK